MSEHQHSHNKSHKHHTSEGGVTEGLTEKNNLYKIPDCDVRNWLVTIAKQTDSLIEAVYTNELKLVEELFHEFEEYKVLVPSEIQDHVYALREAYYRFTELNAEIKEVKKRVSRGLMSDLIGCGGF